MFGETIFVKGIGSYTRLDDDLFQIVTDLPGHSFGHLNTYVFVTKEGLVIIDAPWDVGDAYRNFQELFKQAGLDIEQTTVLLASHYHDDHIGIAYRLKEDFDIPLAMLKLDAENYADRALDMAQFLEDVKSWLIEIGADQDTSKIAIEHSLNIDLRTKHVNPDIVFSDLEMLKFGELELLAVHTPGHTEGHVSFFEQGRGLAFTGDHIYKKIRGNASTRPYASSNPLGDWMDSNERILELSPKTILPAHDEIFYDFEGRFQELKAIYDRKLAEVVLLAESAGTATEIAARVKRKHIWGDLNVVAMLTAIGEAHGYLIEARDLGLVVDTKGSGPKVWKRV